jgi:hypothetical protein
MKHLNIAASFALAAVAAFSGKTALAEDQELKIGVVAAESGSFVSAGNTIVAAGAEAGCGARLFSIWR